MSAVLVLGAAGSLGIGVVDAALDAGRSVIAVADAARVPVQALTALRARAFGQSLDVIEAPLATESDAAALVQRLVAGGHRIDGVVAAIGGESACGRVLDQPAEVLRRTLDEELLPQLVAARHLFPLLARTRRSSGYVLVGGPGADYPWSGYGHRSIVAAALRMLARVLHEEARQAGLQVHLLSVAASERGVGPCSSLDLPWPQARVAARRALALLDAPPGSEPCVVTWPPKSLTSTKVEATRCPSFSDVDAKDAVDRLLASPAFSRNTAP